MVASVADHTPFFFSFQILGSGPNNAFISHFISGSKRVFFSSFLLGKSKYPGKNIKLD